MAIPGIVARIVGARSKWCSGADNLLGWFGRLHTGHGIVALRGLHIDPLLLRFYISSASSGCVLQKQFFQCLSLLVCYAIEVTMGNVVKKWDDQKPDQKWDTR